MPTMSDVSGDQFALIRIEGMHCHRCEETIQRALQTLPGVHEVEVDFASGQASVLFDPKSVAVPQLVESITDAGYRTTGFSQGQADTASRQPPVT
jgi:copper chaperone CopZ